MKVSFIVCYVDGAYSNAGLYEDLKDNGNPNQNVYEDLRGNTDQNRIYEKMRSSIYINTPGEYKTFPNNHC